MARQLHFLPIETVVAGEGAVTRLGERLSRNGCSRAMLVTSRSLSEAKGALDWLQCSLGRLSISKVMLARAHAQREDVTHLVEALKNERTNGVIGFGGGSVFDVIKGALSELIEEGRSIPAHIAIPTTLSGSEFAHYFGVTEAANSRPHKASFANPAVTARFIALDPQATAYTPDHLWTSSGLKSFDHAIEGLIGTAGTPVLETQLQCGIRRLAVNLDRSRDLENLHARAQAQIGAWENYFAPASMILGLSHRIGHVLGGRYGVPHGYTSAVTLASVCRAAAPYRADALSLAARALDTNVSLDLGVSSDVPPEVAADLVSEFAARFALPRRLGDLGLGASVVPEIAREILEEHPTVLPAIGIASVDDTARKKLENFLGTLL